MDELSSPTGPRKEVVQNHCLEFMQLIKVIAFPSLNLQYSWVHIHNSLSELMRNIISHVSLVFAYHEIMKQIVSKKLSLIQG